MKENTSQENLDQKNWDELNEQLKSLKREIKKTQHPNKVDLDSPLEVFAFIILAAIVATIFFG